MRDEKVGGKFSQAASFSLSSSAASGLLLFIRSESLPLQEPSQPQK
jgi:hypothetical protein